MKKSFILKIIFSLMTLCVVILFGFYFVFLSRGIKVLPQGAGSSGTERKYNILVASGLKGETFSRQVLRGAQATAQKYNCAIEFFVPENQAEDYSVQALFDYASYIDADGVIAYIPAAEKNLTLPVKRDGSPIPLVTVGAYIPELPQVSYIGLDFSELGRTIAEEILYFTGGQGNAYILYSDFLNNNYDLLLKSLMAGVKNQPKLHISTVNITQEKNSQTGFISQKLLDSDGKALFVTLSEENSVSLAQSIPDFYQSKKISIIGFSNGADSRAYFEKGIITELILVNSLEIGRRAVEEIFQYKKDGKSSSYIIAGIDVLKKGGQK